MKKDYQRMTEKAKDGSPALITEMIFHEFEKLQGQGKRRYYTDSDVLNIVIKYLAELEDKIENGTLVELPCKVGDTVYVVSRYYSGIWEIYKCIVDNYTTYGKITFASINGTKNDEYVNFGVPNTEFNKSVFLTKAEAKAKLRELKGDGE